MIYAAREDNVKRSVRENGLKKTRQLIAIENSNFNDEFVCLESNDKGIAGASSYVKAIWRNRRFLVQIWQQEGYPTCLKINRTQLDSQGQYQDGITWDEMQEIKNAVGFADQDFIEVFPKVEHFAYNYNIRHLWLLEPGQDYRSERLRDGL